MTRNVPIRTLKDTTGFLAMVQEEPEPIVVTRNGEEAFVAMKPSDYDRLRKEGVRAELLSMLAQDDEDIANGNYIDGELVLAEVDEEIQKLEVLVDAQTGGV